MHSSLAPGRGRRTRGRRRAAVRPRTRDKVLAAIDDLGFRRSAAARALAAGRSGLIGILAAESHSFYGTATAMAAIEQAVEDQARALPRCDIARQAIAKSIIVQVESREEAVEFSNEWAPEHLILQVEDADEMVDHIVNAGSVFVGAYSPES